MFHIHRFYPIHYNLFSKLILWKQTFTRQFLLTRLLKHIQYKYFLIEFQLTRTEKITTTYNSKHLCLIYNNLKVDQQHQHYPCYYYICESSSIIEMTWVQLYQYQHFILFLQSNPFDISRHHTQIMRWFHIIDTYSN